MLFFLISSTICCNAPTFTPAPVGIGKLSNQALLRRGLMFGKVRLQFRLHFASTKDGDVVLLCANLSSESSCFWRRPCCRTWSSRTEKTRFHDEKVLALSPLSRQNSAGDFPLFRHSSIFVFQNAFFCLSEYIPLTAMQNPPHQIWHHLTTTTTVLIDGYSGAFAAIRPSQEYSQSCVTSIFQHCCS